MRHDYLATLSDIPARHRGLIIEQLHLASVIPAFAMRGLGLSLPGQESVPTQAEVFDHLCVLTNRALQNYFDMSKLAPNNPPNEVWGEEGDDVFHVEITALSKDGDGYTIDVNLNLLNLLYR